MSDNLFKKYATVILELALDKMLDYGIPDSLLESITKGSKVQVPIRGKLTTAFVYDLKERSEFSKIQPIHSMSDKHIITDDLLKLATWMSEYYCAPMSRVLKTVLPSTIRKKEDHKEQYFVSRNRSKEELASYCSSIRNKAHKKALVLDHLLSVEKGIFLSQLLEEASCSRSSVDSLVKDGYLSLEMIKIDRSPLKNEEYFPTKHKKLNSEQSEALEKITKTLNNQHFETHLLFGITGSGKTEVYLQAIDKALHLEKNTIMLVPEISLTPQTVERFRSRFGDLIAILHHRLSEGERFDEWHKIKEGKARIVIGARSAIFCPLPNLGLIIVDEEHESSYKQNEEAPCYHARDVAVMRGKLTNSCVILGSATPSIESFYNTKQGKFTLSHLGNRADSASMPKVQIVDLKKEYEKAKGYTNFSEVLLDGIQKRIEVGEQTILFLNRRGYHTVYVCKGCGESIKCNHCDVALTYHKNSSKLACHHCGYCLNIFNSCPKCKCETMQYKGVGTEQIEKALYAILPQVRIIRMDADTTRHKGSHQKLLKEFGTGKADVLIGTQMIAKGLHFPQVTLVGILNSDSALNIPDFRASETVFQLITQVSGRAGRGSLKGEVIIQTRIPENSTILLASEQNYEKFFEDEIQTRHFFRYPPYLQLVKIVFSGINEQEVVKLATLWNNKLGFNLKNPFEILPVTPSGHAKIKDRFRYQFLIKGPSIYEINRAIKQLFAYKSNQIKILIDINPLSTFF